MSTPVTNAQDPAMPSEPYGRAYRTWKGWAESSFGELSAVQRKYFLAELRRTGLDLPRPLDVLEIGFGNGSFLAFARQQGWRISGTEMSQELVNSACAKGFDARHDLEFASFPEESFDLVVAFDVLEHIEQHDLAAFVARVLRVLRTGGRFLARFPNGDSPFSCVFQNGDPTHRSWIGSFRAHSLAAETGCEVAFLGGETKLLFAGDLKSTLKRLITIPAGFLMNAVLCAAVFDHTGFTLLSPNLVVVFKRPNLPAPATIASPDRSRNELA